MDRTECKVMIAAELERCRLIAVANGWPTPKYALRLCKLRWGPNGHARCRIRDNAAGFAPRSIHNIALDLETALSAGERFVQTVAHEYAHVVQTERRFREVALPAWYADGRIAGVRAWNGAAHGRWGAHGDVWQETMAAFGRPATVQTSY